MTHRRRRACLLGVALAWGLVLPPPFSAKAGDALSLQRPPPEALRVRVQPVPPGLPFRDANLILTVEDVSAQDAAARVLARKVFKGVTYDGRPETDLLYPL